MGCCVSNKEENPDAEDLFMREFEQSLIFSSVPTESISSECYRLDSHLLISDKQLETFSKRFKIIPFSPEYQLLMKTYDRIQHKFLATRIITLSILLSQDHKSEKIRALFELYDRKKYRQMTQVDIKIMIVDIFEIAVEILVHQASLNKHNKMEDLLSNYSEKIVAYKNFIIFYFFHYFVDAKQFVSFEDFNKSFNKKEMVVLLVPRLLRMFCYKFYKTADDSYKLDEGNIQLDILEMKRFSKRLTKISISA